MKYEKPQAEKFWFGDEASFMTFSGGTAGQSQAEQAALGSQEVASAMADVGGQCYAEVAHSEYNSATGQWTITVNINNHGGHTKKVVVVIE